MYYVNDDVIIEEPIAFNLPTANTDKSFETSVCFSDTGGIVEERTTHEYTGNFKDHSVNVIAQ